MYRVAISKTSLEDLYIKQKLTFAEIAQRLGCSPGAVWKRLHAYGIEARLPWNAVDLTQKKLAYLYLKKRLSTWAIEQNYGYSRGTVHRKLHEYHLPIRNLAQSHIIYPRKNFSNNPIEKAYLVGFAIGDLRVRKVYQKSETIHIDCASTHSAQLQLISQLFKPYGRVWIGRPDGRGAQQIECSVDDSFRFLLRKRKVADHWIMERIGYFAAFLAGFTDAEGCISINGAGQAFYSLGNYNRFLLEQIRRKLIRCGIPCKELQESKIRGRTTAEKYRHNQNYWIFSITRKVYLLRLFDLIGKYAKHREKKVGWRRVLKNIEIRNKKFGNLRMEN